MQFMMSGNQHTAPGPDKVIDVRPIPCSVRHGLIICNGQERLAGSIWLKTRKRRG